MVLEIDDPAWDCSETGASRNRAGSSAKRPAQVKNRDSAVSTPQAAKFDIIISGASFAGLALALGLSRAAKGGLQIAIVDKRLQDQGPDSEKDQGQAATDQRAFALAAGSVYLLSALSVWDEFRSDAQPVETIKITDSALEAGVRPVLLTYDNHLENGDPASYIVPASKLLDALKARLSEDDAIAKVACGDIAALDQGPSRATITLNNGAALSAPLVIAADGAASKLRDLAGIKVVRWTHDQQGIVTTIGHSKPHNATAIQHFLPGGPFAILPLTGDRSCITWSEDEEVARRMLALSDEAFLAEIDKRVGGKLGILALEGERQSWPLATHMARSFIAPRLAVVGDAAHGVHPLAGQGLNLGFRDVAALVDVVIDAAGLGLDIGASNVLERYERWRRYDSTISAAAFDGLNRLFSKDWTLLRSAREVGLGSVDRIETIKAFFVKEAAGQSGEVPRLMQKHAA